MGRFHRAIGRAAVIVATVALASCVRTGSMPVVQPQPRAFLFAHVADSIIESPPLNRAHLGIMVYDPVARRVLYEHNADRRFVPASNQKYWPTATALHALGPDYRYRTPVLGIGFDAASGTAAALVVAGRGDPTMSARFHADDHTALEGLADSIAAAGVRRVTGDLIIDASWFDDAIIPGSWTYGNLNTTSAPATGAFAVAEGLFRVHVQHGGAAGEAAQLQVVAPIGMVPLVSTLGTAPAAAGTSLSITRGPWDDTLRITGVMAADAEPRMLRVPMTDPVRFAAHVLADALAARGVVIEGGVSVVRDAADAAAIREGRVSPSSPLTVTPITVWTSPPLSEIVAAILQPSQNWIAEQLVRTLGAEKRGEGSWRAGVAAQTTFLFGTVGIDSAALRLQDGSGMSHQNLVTPRAIVQLLDHARSAPWRAVFRAGLTGPGMPGTLSSRLPHLQGRLAGKTGTLSNVNALSGYVTTWDGRELIFVILSNASGLPAPTVVAAMDQLVTVLADDGMDRVAARPHGAAAAISQPLAQQPHVQQPHVQQPHVQQPHVQQPHALPANVITDWRTTAPLGHAAEANRRNVPPGGTLEFHDLVLTVVETSWDSAATTGRVDFVRLRLDRQGEVTERMVEAGSAFNWSGYHVAVIASPRPGELGGGLVALEVATLTSLPPVVAHSTMAGGAELRLRVPHRITNVTLHHTGFPEPLRPGEDPVLRLRNLQSWGAAERNWWDVPYHFLIDLEGRVYEGRDWRYKGDTNTTYEPAGHFLISVIGNYEIQEPTTAQVDAIADLMAWAVDRFDLTLDRIGGHYHFAATACPGVHFRGMLEDGTFRGLVQERLDRR
jgi:serine-type D-Ala-D-Ala carboxypeptidase/endopeptidase (penicillin-binding protein 4)